MRGWSLIAILGVAGVVVLVAIVLALFSGDERLESAATNVVVAIADNPAAPGASGAQEAEVVAEIPNAIEDVEDTEIVEEIPAISQDLLIADTIRQTLGDPVLKQNAHPDDIAALEAFYSAHTGAALWLDTAGISEKGKAVLAAMANARDWGVDPGIFTIPPPEYQPTAAEDQAATEIAISLAVLKYARAARSGGAEPSAIAKVYAVEPTVRPPKEVMTEIAASSTPDGYLTGLHPKHPQFEKLRQALMKAQTDAEKERIEANMDRWRWMPEALGETYVWLNIPEFMLHVVKDGETVQSEKAVVGKPNTPTPVLSADMTEIIFNPERVVPLSVIRRDVLPKLRKSGGLFGVGAAPILEQYQLTVKNRGRAIDPDKIDWDAVDLSKLTFVQAPGPTNILGKVQFLYPNDRDIYLHDTIIKAQLLRAVRAEGQEEPRVANPEKLAERLLVEGNGLSAAQASQLASSGSTSSVKLDKPIPVHMTYFTVVVNDQGEMKTFDDVYQLDDRREPDDAAAVTPRPGTGDTPLPERKPSLASTVP